MEETVEEGNSTTSSDVEGTHDNMSYIYGRNPSILAFSQRPIPNMKQNLISLYEDEEVEYSDENGSLNSESLNLQTVKVYLRMKPFPRKIKLTQEEADAYQITSSTTLVTKLPSLDSTISSIKSHKSSHAVCRKFTFTQTFGPETTQFQLFEDTIQQRMVDFLSGANCTVMTYGTTNSGKSYTLQGTTTSPGIIPRGLEFVFSNVSPRPTPCYKPVHSNKVVSLSAIERAQELEAKNKFLTFGSLDKHQYINSYKQMQKFLQEESPIRPSRACDAHYSVWVSFAEIYNENIYDLLSNDCQRRRPLLKLATDSDNRAFIKGLKTICVNSGSEAYQVLMAGQYNLKVAATALNARSSRSHCIFTIHLLKYYIENVPDSVKISTFTFCDLAGSERLKKTLNVGDRLKEAQNINTSLLVLGRCLKSIYEGQAFKQRHEHVGPFRESKLTRLFQRALSGKEQIALIVNVNPVPNLYVETQNVLNFSAIAKKIIVEPKKIRRKVSKTRFSQIVAQSRKSNTDWDPLELCDIVESAESSKSESLYVNPEDYEDLLEENEALRKEISALKASALERDFQIRQELTQTYTAMMKKLENDWKDRIKDVEAQSEDNFEWRVNAVENFYKEKINELISRKRRRTASDTDDEVDYGALEVENSRLQAKIHSLKKTMKHLRENNETFLTEKNKMAFELSLANDERKNLKDLLSKAQSSLCKDDDSAAYVEELKKQLHEKQEHIRKLKEFLNEAKEEYIAISSDAQMMEDRLKDRDEALAEATESIADLKSMIENTNVCLEEKTKVADLLEEKLREAEEKYRMLEEKSEEELRELKEKLESLKKSSANSSQEAIPAIEIKKEILSESEGDTSTDFSNVRVPATMFIKTDVDEGMRIPTTPYDRENRENEMYVQVQELNQNQDNDEISDEKIVELRARLRTTEAENLSLKEKLSQSVTEIQLLHETLNVAKEQLNDVTRKINELKVKNSAAGPGDNSLTKDALERSKSSEIEAESNEMSTQTDRIDERNRSMQTSLLESSEEKSVQATDSGNEELIVLREKLLDLERDCRDKEQVIMKFEKNIEKLRIANESLESQSKKDEECIERLKGDVKCMGERLSNAISEKDNLQHLLSETEEMKRSLDIQINECKENYEKTIATLTSDLRNAAEEKQKVEKSLVDVKELRQKLQSVSTECKENYEKTIATLTSDLKNAVEEKQKVEKSLVDVEELYQKLQSVTTECKENYEKTIATLTSDLKNAVEEKQKVEKSLVDVEELRQKLQSVTTECQTTHKVTIKDLKEELAMTKKRENTHLETITEHIRRIDELNKCTELLEIEKKVLGEKMTENMKELETLKLRLVQAEVKDREKDEEIRTLQKSYKNHLAADILSKEIQEKLDKATKELSDTKEVLARTDELYQRLRKSSNKEIEELESQILSLEMKSKNLKIERDELKTLLTEKDNDLQSFVENRNKAFLQYETLVSSLQEENARDKKKLSRFEELVHKTPVTPRGRAVKNEDQDQRDQIQVVESSDSEQKGTRRRAALQAPSGEVKRSTRKKKLYTNVDDSSVDVDSCDASLPAPSPSTSTRNLRTRKR